MLRAMYRQLSEQGRLKTTQDNNVNTRINSNYYASWLITSYVPHVSPAQNSVISVSANSIIMTFCVTLLLNTEI